MSMIYKLILSSYGFEAPFLLLSGQAAAGLIFTLAAMRFFPAPMLQLPEKLSWDVYKASFVVGALYVANLAVGWYGLALVDVPMFLAIRRTTTILVMIVEFMMLGTVPSGQVRMAVGVLMLGTVVAAWDTFNDDFRGYMFTIGNNVITAFQSTAAKRFSKQQNIKGFGLVLYNSITAVPLSLLLAGLQGEFAYAYNHPAATDPTFYVAVTVASCAGAFMTYVVLLCTTVNSPTATSVTGNIKDIVTTFIGAWLFPGFVPTFGKILGLGISFAGGGWFTYSKLMERDAPAPKPADEEPSAGAMAVAHAADDDGEEGDTVPLSRGQRDTDASALA